MIGRMEAIDGKIEKEKKKSQTQDCMVKLQIIWRLFRLTFVNLQKLGMLIP